MHAWITGYNSEQSNYLCQALLALIQCSWCGINKNEEQSEICISWILYLYSQTYCKEFNLYIGCYKLYIFRKIAVHISDLACLRYALEAIMLAREPFIPYIYTYVSLILETVHIAYRVTCIYCMPETVHVVHAGDRAYMYVVHTLNTIECILHTGDRAYRAFLRPSISCMHETVHIVHAWDRPYRACLRPCISCMPCTEFKPVLTRFMSCMEPS